ncbi:MAG: DUF4160 domain-containing protein [Chloroflexi bacterium]|nr:DUF4160 domain-containing protein [Chloroflexota bacterium]
MPEISCFHGIIIAMYFESGRHHRPHFHARYGEYKASVAIDPPTILAGALPRRQQNLVLAWAELHQKELLDNWHRASQQKPLQTITGLQ